MPTEGYPRNTTLYIPVTLYRSLVTSKMKDRPHPVHIAAVEAIQRQCADFSTSYRLAYLAAIAQHPGSLEYDIEPEEDNGVIIDRLNAAGGDLDFGTVREDKIEVQLGQPQFVRELLIDPSPGRCAILPRMNDLNIPLEMYLHLKEEAMTYLVKEFGQMKYVYALDD